MQNHPDWPHFEALPFSSYSPLTAGTRGRGIGGLKLMPDDRYYGCCACIGAAGIGLVPKMHPLLSGNGIVLNLFIDGEITTQTPSGAPITLKTVTDYPCGGTVTFSLTLIAPESFTLSIRNPQWSKRSVLTVNGENVPVSDGYISMTREWKNKDRLSLSLDMRTEVIRPIPYGEMILMNKVIWGKNYMISTFDREDPSAHLHRAFRRGPLVLAQDERLGYSTKEAIKLQENDDGTVDATVPKDSTVPFRHILEVTLSLANGTSLTLVDYASAGKLYTDEYKMAAWILTE